MRAGGSVPNKPLTSLGPDLKRMGSEKQKKKQNKTKHINNHFPKLSWDLLAILFMFSPFPHKNIWETAYGEENVSCDFGGETCFGSAASKTSSGGFRRWDWSALRRGGHVQ